MAYALVRMVAGECSDHSVVCVMLPVNQHRVSSSSQSYNTLDELDNISHICIHDDNMHGFRMAQEASSSTPLHAFVV